MTKVKLFLYRLIMGIRNKTFRRINQPEETYRAS
jgi:hypothetical protein